MRCVKAGTVLLAASFLLFFGPMAAQAAVVYDLNSDWSNTNNPNGVWEYRAGTNLLIDVPDWGTPATLGYPQQAWGVNANPCMGCGNLLPAIFKATGTRTGDDYQVGDVVMHTNSPVNGNDIDIANVAWIAPFNAIIDISGVVWQTGFLTRDNTATLLVNGVPIQTVLNLNTYSRSSPASLSDTGVTVNAGEVVELELYRNGTEGYLVGLDLTITASPTAVPEPGTGILFAAGSVLCAALARRKLRSI